MQLNQHIWLTSSSDVSKILKSKDLFPASVIITRDRTPYDRNRYKQLKLELWEHNLLNTQLTKEDCLC